MYEKDRVTVEVADEPSDSGIHFAYDLFGWSSDDEDAGGEHLSEIEFQRGPVEDGMPNGWTLDALLAVVQHRLECEQSGDCKSVDGDFAISYIRQARERLAARHPELVAKTHEGAVDVTPVADEDETDDGTDAKRATDGAADNAGGERSEQTASSGSG